MSAPGLQRQLESATQAARDAYRDTTRLIRLLSVLGQPAPPEELLDRVLAVLSEVFFAEVTVVAHQVGTRLVIDGACGLPEDDPAFQDGWPVVPQAAEALRRAEVVADQDLDQLGLPGSVARLNIRSAAWVPLSNGGSTQDLLILLRRTDAPFTLSDQQVLSSVAARLRLALDERERTEVIEQLARYGHRLAQHLDLEPLLDEAAGLLRQLIDADQVWVVTVHGERARLRAHRGLVEADLAGWPRPVGPVDPERPVVRQRPYLTSRPTAGTLASGRRPDLVLEVPVGRDGELRAVLFATRERRRPFAEDAPEVAAIFANYLAVAMVNAELYRTLRTRATQDPLTGLANRAVVRQHLENLLTGVPAAGFPGPHVGVLFCDLDRFKAVNDLYGHEAGDELLQQVARRLQASLRPSDLLARFGGDEFVVVLDGVRDLSEVAEVGRRLSRELAREVVVRGERIPISASIGGVLGTPGESSATALLRDADAAMYAAKERGLGQVEVFDQAASSRALDRLDLRSELARALERGQLHLRYQPIVQLETGWVVAFEALLRWEHPRHGSVPPEVFVPLAEDSGLIVPIGRWVLRQACEQLAAWRRLPGAPPVAVSVNLSFGELRHEALVRQTLETIRAAGLRPGDVWLEVTEQSYLHHDMSVSAAALRQAGIHFALDDFGTAYSSLSFLRRFPIEIVKIDRSFMDGVTEPGADQSIVRAILAITASLGLTAVAEGVETAHQREVLRALGCELGQGHLFAPPLTAQEATSYLAGDLVWPEASAA